MSQELQTSGQFTTLSLWGSPIRYDKKVVQLKEFSAFLEQRAKKSAEDFLLIGQQQKMGWLIAGTDFLEKEMRQVCSEVGEYITAHNILDNPNWELFLQPKIMFADAAKQLTLNLHDTLVAACINNMEEQAQQAYRNSLANSEGLGFGIISNSLTAHFLYAMQAAQKDRENEQAAQDAANRVRRNSSPVEKAGELTAKAYHETHEPYVIDSLAQFYGEVESFIYTGADYDKTRLDALAKEAVETIDTADCTGMQAAIVLAVQKDICCGEAVFAAIHYGLVDDDFIKFCEYAPLKLLKNSFKPITAWLKKEKHTNQLYNRPVFGAKTMQNLRTVQRVFLSNGKLKPALYNKILEDIYADEISNAFSAFNGIFHFDNSALDRYASNGNHLIVSDPIVSLMILLCNDLYCSKLVSLVSGAGLVLPITRDQLHECIDEVNNKIDVRHAEIQVERKEKAIRDAANQAERERIEAEDRARKQAEAEKKRQHTTKIVKIAATVLIPLIVFAAVWNFWLLPDVIQPGSAYDKAQALLAEGQYDAAINAFASLGNYKNSAEMVDEAKYQKATSLLADQNYDDALLLFDEIRAYLDSAEKIKETIYQKALYLSNTGSLAESIDLLESLDGYADSAAELEKIQYAYANELFEQGKYDDANAIYQNISTYENSTELMLECDYQKATHYYETEVYDSAIEVFQSILEYKDSEDMVVECKYHSALQKMGISEYTEAIAIFEEIIEYEDSNTQIKECKYLLAKGYLATYQYDSAKSLLEELGEYKDSTEYLQLLSQVKSLAYQMDDNYQYWYLWVYVIIDVDNCSLKVMAQEARSWDLVSTDYIEYEQNYKIDYIWKFEEWAYEGGKYLMVFEGTDPTEDRHSFRAWTISNDWSSIRSQTMTYDGEILGDPGEYFDHYVRITDEEIAQKVIDSIQRYVDW